MKKNEKIEYTFEIDGDRKMTPRTQMTNALEISLMFDEVRIERGVYTITIEKKGSTTS